MHLEVERKFEAKDIKGLREKLKKDGFSLCCSQQIENDTYFTDKDRKFISSLICLRIRETNDTLEMTYKGKSINNIGLFAKMENNLKLEKSQKKDAIAFLKSLGYLVYCDVNKTRDVRTKTLENITYNVMFDNIYLCGDFIEFELIVDDYDPENNYKQALNEFASQYMKFVGKEVVLPYRDLVRPYI